MESKSPDELDEFLSAPDSVRLSEAERRKAAVRKAKLEAEERRIRATKEGGEPTTEDVLADLIRVAEDPETNPQGYRFRTLSRKRYRVFGHFPVDAVDRMFGQFEHAKQVAGLEDQPGTRRKKAAIAEASRREHAGRYLERYVRPYVRQSERSADLILSISDTHATFLDPFTWACFLRAARDLEPDVVYLNGDILEGSEISRHPKIPGWTVPLQLEFDFAREMFRQVREAAPDAEIWWGAGNHGLDRIASYLTQVAPAFASLRSMRFDKLADLDGLGVRLAQGGTIASPAGTEDEGMGTLFNGFYRVHHGTKLGATPALTELRAAGRSGQSGHVHRASVIYGTTEADRGMSWMTTPMGCSHRAGRAYMKGSTTGWQTGLAVAFLSPEGRVHQYPVVTEGGRCMVEGYEYVDPGYGTPDATRLWIKDFTL